MYLDLWDKKLENSTITESDRDDDVVEVLKVMDASSAIVDDAILLTTSLFVFSNSIHS